MSDDYLRKCMYKYWQIILKYEKEDLYKLSNNDVGKLYEYLWAVKLNMFVWEDVPPSWVDLPSKDIGIDLINKDKTNTVQCKCFRKPATIKWAKFSTFHTLTTKLNLTPKDMILCITPLTRLHPEMKCPAFNPVVKKIRELNDLLQEVLLLDIQKPPVVITQSTNLESRPYQLSAFKCFEETKDNLVTKFQLPCRTGKTFIMAHITKHYKKQEPSIVFVNRIALAKQHLLEFQKHGLRVGLIWNKHMCDPKEKDVVICVDASVEKLDSKQKWAYKFLDEAHHYENDSIRTNHIMAISCQRTLMFSATYKNIDNIDFKYSIEDACKDGWITDYRFHMAYFDYGSREDGVVSLVNKYYKSWSPMLVCFNTVENAESFKRKLNNNIQASVYTAQTPPKTRENILTKIKKNAMDVVAVVGCLNEGITIKQLRTVVFGELRDSPINKMQLAMRATTPHYDKECARIVLPVFQKDIFDDPAQLRNLIRSFGDYDRRIKQHLIKKGTTGKIRLTVERPLDEENEISDDECLAYHSKIAATYEKVYDRIGNLLRCSDIDKAKEYLDHVTQNSLIPTSTDKKSKFKNGTFMYQWFMNITSEKSRLEKVKAIWCDNELIQERLEEILKKRKTPKLSDVDKAKEYLDHVTQNHRLPTSYKDKKSRFKDGTSMYDWFKKTTSNRSRLEKVKAILCDNELIQQRLEEISKKSKTPKLSDVDKAKEYLDHVTQNSLIPTSMDKKSKFKDGTFMYQWFMNITSEKSRLEKVKAIWCDNELIQERLEEISKKRKTPKLSDVDKAKEYLDHVTQNHRLPTSRCKKSKFKDGTVMYEWFKKTTSNRSRLEKVKAILCDNELIQKRLEEKSKKRKTPKLSDVDKAKEYLDHVNQNHLLPTSYKDKKSRFKDGTSMYDWFMNISSEKSLARFEKVKAILCDNELIQERLEEISKKSKKPKLSDVDKAKEYLDHVTQNHRLPTSICKKSKFKDGTVMYTWFLKITSEKSRLEKVKAILCDNELIQERLEEILKKRKTPKLSDVDKATEYLDHVTQNHRLPTSRCKKSKFKDGTLMYAWFMKITSEKSHLEKVNAILCDNELIQERLEEILKKRKTPKLSDVDKAKEYLDHVTQNHRLPTSRCKKSKFKDKTSMYDWFMNISSEKSLARFEKVNAILCDNELIQEKLEERRRKEIGF